MNPIKSINNLFTDMAHAINEEPDYVSAISKLLSQLDLEQFSPKINLLDIKSNMLEIVALAGTEALTFYLASIRQLQLEKFILPKHTNWHKHTNAIKLIIADTIKESYQTNITSPSTGKSSDFKIAFYRQQ